MAAHVEQQRPRSKSMLSFGSGRSRKSSGGGGPAIKLDLTENAKEKASRRMTSKANPITALNEAQPGNFEMT